MLAEFSKDKSKAEKIHIMGIFLRTHIFVFDSHSSCIVFFIFYLLKIKRMLQLDLLILKLLHVLGA